MSYTTHVDNKHALVEIIHHGHVDIHETIRARADVAKIVKEQSIHRALFDLADCELNINPSDLYRFGNSFDQAGIPANMVIGGVLKSNDEKGRFLENVVQNRFMNIRFFTSRDEATQWLGV